MREKKRNLSQKHQVKSDHSELKSTNTLIIKNRSHLSFEDRDPKEILSKYDDENHQNNYVPFNQDDIIGWEWSNKHNHSKKAEFFQKEIKPHEKRKFMGKLEPIGIKNIEKSSTNDTISYLKHMLCLLRSSRDVNNPDCTALKQRNGDHLKPKPHQTFDLKNGENPSKGKRKKKVDSQQTFTIIEKQNEYNDSQIIEQLIHGLTKLPKISQSKKSTLNIRTRKGSKFTLDKLLI